MSATNMFGLSKMIRFLWERWRYDSDASPSALVCGLICLSAGCWMKRVAIMMLIITKKSKAAVGVPMLKQRDYGMLLITKNEESSGWCLPC